MLRKFPQVKMSPDRLPLINSRRSNVSRPLLNSPGSLFSEPLTAYQYRVDRAKTFHP